MSDYYRSLNVDFLCGKYKDPEPFDDKEGYFSANLFEKQINRAVINDIGSGNTNSVRLLTNKKFSKFLHLERIGVYFSGIFALDTKDKKFKATAFQVGKDIISKGFFGEVYIGCDEGLYEQEREVIEAKGRNGGDSSNFPYSKIRLYVMERDNTKKKSKEPKFRSVGTNVGGLKIDPERLVYFSLDGFKNFMAFGEILEEYLNGLDNYVNYFHAATKRIAIDVQDAANADSQMDQLLNSTYPFLVLDNVNKSGGVTDNTWSQFPAPEMEGIAVVMRSIQAWGDERVRGYGIIGTSLRQTKERSNVGETYMDYEFANSIRQSYLANIEGMIERCKELFKEIFPEDLSLKEINQSQMNQQFDQMNNWKGGDQFEGNHHNSLKPVRQ